MPLLVHRGQVVLLLVVGVLAGVAVAGFCLEMDGVSVLGVLRVNELFAPPRSEMPAQIVIGHAAAPSNEGGLAGSTAAKPAPEVAPPPTAPAPVPVRPAPTTAVVPANVYTYPPDDHGGGSGGGHGGRGS